MTVGESALYRLLGTGARVLERDMICPLLVGLSLTGIVSPHAGYDL